MKLVANGFRQMLQRCKRFGPQKIPSATAGDIPLWIETLNYVSKEGVDINNVTFTEPSITCISDACEFGMGGYNLDGLAWRYELKRR